MASTALYGTSAASAKFLSTASDPSSTRSKAVKVIKTLLKFVQSASVQMLFIHLINSYILAAEC